MSLKKFGEKYIVLSPYQGFNFFHLSVYHTAPALSYWAFNFLESTYIVLIWIGEDPQTHLNYSGFWGWEVRSLGVRLTAIHLTESFPC